MLQHIRIYLQSRTYREKMVLCLLSALILMMLFFLIMIYPKVRSLQQSQKNLNRAKTGYNFILQNAFRVAEGGVQSSPDDATPVEQAATKAVEQAGIKASSVKAIGNAKVQVQIDDAVPFSDINKMLANLEKGFGITVDEISLDKQGDGVIYVSRLVLIRLDREGEDSL